MPNKWLPTALILLTLIQMAACGGGGEGPPADQFSIGGTITPAAISAVDSDVNDPNASFAANDTHAQAQLLPVPVILAGYVNLAGQGEPGRSLAAGDPQDFFHLPLSAGDSILLVVASPIDTDMDLYLYRADDFSLVDASLGTDKTESLSANEDGQYIVEVRIFDEAQATTGASNYNLIIGDAADISDSTGLRLSQAFVPGEIVVRFADILRAAWATPFSSANIHGLGMDLVRGEIGREMLFSIETAVQARSALAAPNLKSASTSLSETLQRKLETLKAIKTLKKRADIRDAAPNFMRQPFVEPNDKFFGLQWHYDLIHLPQAWDTISGGDGVVVAVVDTGVLSNHPDLGARLTSDGYDFISQSSIEGNEPASEKGGIDPNPEDPGDKSTGGSSFHGTHVAGTVAANTDNAIGVAGAGWDTVRIMPLRALGVGGGTSYDIIQAVRYAAGLSNDSGTVPSRTADIINMSLGGGGSSTVEQNLYRTISQQGVIVVAAAGNEGKRQDSYPAAYDGVISVSAVDFSSKLAYYSNFGDTVDVAAPGGDNSADLNADGYPDGVLSTTGDDTSGSIKMGYSFSQGTSMAAPHVAGVAALMKAVWPQMGYVQFETLLSNGLITTDLGTPGKDEAFGYGLIDADKAILAARDGVLPTAISVSPSAIRFGTTLATASLRLVKTGDENAALAVNAVNDDADWVMVSPDQIDGDGLGTYTVQVDRAGLADGVYDGTITFVSSANTVHVPISMQVHSAGRVVDAGYHYVLLLDSETQAVLKQAEATLDDGVYHFAFANIDPGDYLLWAGSDMDNDFVIGDLGNAIGAYLSTDQPIVVHVDRDVADLDFRTEFNINLLDEAKASNPVAMDRSIQRTQPKEMERIR